ncbi:MAG: hypothetical protein ACK4K4_01615 [Caldimicrobium sp.]
MYLSRKITLNGYSYRLCESYYDSPFFKSKILFELGTNPEEFITYYSDVSFSIELEEELLKVGKKTDQFELEKVFLPFLKPEARRWVIFSLNRKGTTKSCAKTFKLEEIHWFDRVRLIALKLDHRDPHRVVNHPFPFYKNLLEKSRDEIENYLWDMEDKLNFRERSTYLLSIFSLHRVSSLEERDKLFLENLCKIAQDPKYYMYLSEKEVLSNYLSRYVWIYFDFLPVRRIPKFFLDLEKDNLMELSKILNISVEVLLHSTKREVLKLFRKKLLEVHPDKGGSHEEFIRIRQLMEMYLKRF